MDIPQIWENRDKYINGDEKETGNMCQAIRELMEDARNEGIESGIEQSLKVFTEFAQEMHLSKEDTMQKLREKYGLAEDKLCECMRLYWK